MKDKRNESRVQGVDEDLKKHYPDETIGHTVLSDGDLLLAIEKFVRDEKIDMIAIGAQRRNVFARIFNPSIARRMLFHTDTPLLIIHQ